jgi:hypothetical protein
MSVRTQFSKILTFTTFPLFKLNRTMSTLQDTQSINDQSQISLSSTQFNISEYCRAPQFNEAERDEAGRQLRYCGQPDCLFKSGVVTNFRKHLERRHYIESKPKESAIQVIALQELNNIFVSTGNRTTEDLQTAVFKTILDKEVIQKALVYLIVRHRLPLSLVEWPAFHTFLGTLNPHAIGVIPTSHNTIRAHILNLWKEDKVILTNHLRTASSKINISVDVWTSTNNLLFLGIVAHFVRQNDKQLSKALLGLRTIGGHSGEEQFNILRTVLEEYDIIDNLGVIIGDNATTNDTLCRTISVWFEENGKPEWNAQNQRIRCLGHIINLIVQAFLFAGTANSPSEEDLQSYEAEGQKEVELTDSQKQTRRDKFRLLGAIGKLHNIVIHIRSSSGRTAEFVESAGRRIPLDNCTRWNSWYSMLSVSSKLEKEIDFYCKNQPDLQKDVLSTQDWEWLRTFEGFLKLFHDVTLESEGDNQDLSSALPTLYVIKWHMTVVKAKFEKAKKVRTIPKF